MKTYLMDQLQEPSDEFVKYMASQVFSGRMTENAREKFRGITKKAFTQFISDRLASALSEEKAANTPSEQQPESSQEVQADPKSKIVTTQDEIDGYNAVKAILRTKIDVKRIFIKDTINYCNVLFDNNVRKPLCRFYFNNSENKFINFFAGETHKEGAKIPVETIDDIYLLAYKIEAALNFYLTLEAEKSAKKTQPSDLL